MAKDIFDSSLKGVYHNIDVSQPTEETVDYKQVATLGVEALVAAIVGILGFFWTPFIIASILGLVLGILAQRKIMRAGGDHGGRDDDGRDRVERSVGRDVELLARVCVLRFGASGVSGSSFR